MADDQKPLFSVPQIRSAAANVLTIIVIAPCAGVGLAFLNGELKGWKDFPGALDHGMFIGAAMTFAWLGMASPFGIRFRQLFQETQKAGLDGQVETTKLHIQTSEPVRIDPPAVPDAPKKD